MLLISSPRSCFAALDCWLILKQTFCISYAAPSFPLSFSVSFCAFLQPHEFRDNCTFFHSTMLFACLLILWLHLNARYLSFSSFVRLFVVSSRFISVSSFALENWYRSAIIIMSMMHETESLFDLFFSFSLCNIIRPAEPDGMLDKFKSNAYIASNVMIDTVNDLMKKKKYIQRDCYIRSNTWIIEQSTQRIQQANISS